MVRTASGYRNRATGGVWPTAAARRLWKLALHIARSRAAAQTVTLRVFAPRAASVVVRRRRRANRVLALLTKTAIRLHPSAVPDRSTQESDRTSRAFHGPCCPRHHLPCLGRTSLGVLWTTSCMCSAGRLSTGIQQRCLWKSRWRFLTRSQTPFCRSLD